LKEEIGEMRDEEMATERWENEGGHTLTKYAIARFVRASQSRLETDPLGEVSVPAVALYGVQTQRALDNFRVSNLRIHPALITAYAEIKQAAAEANRATGALKPELANAIIRAAEELGAGQWRDQFQLDVFQAGAGTSYNMNLNEVIANRALELLGHSRGAYEHLHPNDHVNHSQSTNDTMPTAMRIATLRLTDRLTAVLAQLAAAFANKAGEFAEVRKSGRTHLRDAVPMTLGDEFGAYAAILEQATERLEITALALLELPLGGTAVGNGVNTHPDYTRLVIERLAQITGLPLGVARNRFAATQSLGDFVALSGALRGIAVELSKIANDLRLLGSGPHTGLGEIELPAVQPGSSIMPGKVNPVMAEMLNMVCFHILGHDAAIIHCGAAGQLELNVMTPYVAYALLESLETLTNATRSFEEKCVRDIQANRECCQMYAERTVGVAALHNQELGFMGAAKLAQRAVDSGKSVREALGEANKPGKGSKYGSAN
jgi:aspartate ammonia-lyase